MTPQPFATTSLFVLLSVLLFCLAFEIIHVDGYTRFERQGLPFPQTVGEGNPASQQVKYGKH